MRHITLEWILEQGYHSTVAHNKKMRSMPLENNDPPTLSAAWEPFKILIATACLGGLAGLAALLRSDDDLTKRAIFSAVLNSSLLSLGSAALWWYYAPDSNFVVLMGVSVLIGLGGNTSIGIITAIFQKKFNIVIADPKKPKDETDNN
jgi:hypothetical protein